MQLRKRQPIDYSKWCETDDKKDKTYKKTYSTKPNLKLTEPLCKEEECPICLERCNLIELRLCGHKFHSDCLSKWEKKTCPLCRLPTTDTVYEIDICSCYIFSLYDMIIDGKLNYYDLKYSRVYIINYILEEMNNVDDQYIKNIFFITNIFIAYGVVFDKVLYDAILKNKKYLYGIDLELSNEIEEILCKRNNN
jgi:hypothetical protein